MRSPVMLNQSRSRLSSWRGAALGGLLVLCAELSLAAEQPEPAEGDETITSATELPAELDYSRLVFDFSWREPLTAGASDSPDSIAGTLESPPVATAPVQRGPDSPPAEAVREQRDLDAQIRRFSERIGTALESTGPYSAAVRETYQALGLAQQQAGLHEEAIASFESAMHVDRVNGGLYTMQQIPLVESIIASYEAGGNVDEVSNFEEYLYYINQKSFADNDPRLLAAKERWADWNVQAYLKQGNRNTSFNAGPAGTAALGSAAGPEFVAVQNPRNGSYLYVPRSQMLNVLNSPGLPGAMGVNDLYMRSSAFAVSPEMMMDERLRRARDLYQEIVDHPDEDFQRTRERDVELKLANIAFATKREFDALENRLDPGATSLQQMGTTGMPNSLVTQGYTRNRETLEALAARLEQDPGSNPVAVGQAYIDVGDWHLAYDRGERGRDAYRKAIETMKKGNVDAATIASIFNPGPLVPVPGFALHPFSRGFLGLSGAAAQEPAGYFDVELSLTENGRVRDLRIVAAAPEAPQRLRRLLLEYLRNHAMRPQLVDGTLAREVPLSVRVHYYF
ncbi:MAG: hypothetical protein RLZZ169_1751 [Pseudomonadota bacterium]|jgi:tetratricopeptide (TPR) repeat protein